MKLEREDQNTEVVANTTQQPARCRTRMKKAAPPPPGKAEPIATNGSVPHSPPPSVVASPEPGEDCAINELLEGNMELEVILPDKRKVCMTVERRTPMMDLLVHVTTASKIPPGSHIISLWPERRKEIGFKPNTPIGSLYTNVIYIIPKSVEISIRKMPKLANQPFEPTFRLQVNLPRNQKTVLRVSQRASLADVKQQICKEKELEFSQYHLVHPAQTDRVLDLNSTLSDYGCSEISLLSNSSLTDNIRTSNSDLIGYSICDYTTREEEKKKRGILRLFSRKKNVNPNDSIRSRGISPTRSELSLNRSSFVQKQSMKKRPAPLPPMPITAPSNGIESKSISESKTEGGSTVSHSRHSSDSSGYHEPSVFSEYSENKSPETSSGNDSSGVCIVDSPVNQNSTEIKISKKTSTPTKEAPNLQVVPSCSNISVIGTLKKRKAPPPPVPTEPSALADNLQREGKNSTEDTKSGEKISSPSLSPVSSSPVSSSSQTSNEKDVSSSLSPLEDNEKTLTHINPDLSSAYPSPPLSPEPSDQVFSEAESEEKKENTVKGVVNVTKPNNSLSDDLPPPSNNQRAGSFQVSLSSNNPNLNDTPVPRPRLTILQNQINQKKDSRREVELDSSKEVEEKRASLDSIGELEVTFKEIIEEVLQAEKEKEEKSSELSDVSTVQSEVPPEELEKESTPVPIVEVSEINAVSSTDWEYNIPEPPSPFRNNNEELAFDTLSSEITENLKSSNTTVDSNKTSPPPPELPAQPPPPEVDMNKASVEESEDTKQTVPDANETEGPVVESNTNNETKPVPSLPKGKLNKLINFTVGCYKTDEEDIYAPQDTSHVKRIIKLTASDNKTLNQESKTEELTYNNKKSIIVDQDKDKNSVHIKPKQGIMSSPSSNQKTNLTEAVVETAHGIKSQSVQRKPTVMLTISPFSSTRSSSMVNLNAEKETQGKLNFSTKPEIQSHILKRTQSDQNLKDLSPTENANMDQEQKRLYQEYYKLQGQFVAWQQQLIHNQALLQNKQILPQLNIPQFTAFNPSWNMSGDSLKTTKQVDSVSYNESTMRPEGSSKTRPKVLPKPMSRPSSLINLTSTQNEEKFPNTFSDTYSLAEDKFEARSQTLPRPKPHLISVLNEGKSLTLDRRTRPKSGVVAVSIGSWDQRNQQANVIGSTSVASTRLKFKSLENISLENGRKALPCNDQDDTNRKALSGSANISSKEKVIEEPSTSVGESVSKKSEAPVKQSSLPSKPLVRVSSMKADIHITSTNPKTDNHQWDGKRETPSAAAIIAKIREELKTGARHPAGSKSAQGTEQVTNYEQCVKPSELTRKENIQQQQESKNQPKQRHITKVNINDIPKNKSHPTLNISSGPPESSTITTLKESKILGKVNNEVSTKVNGKTTVAIGPIRSTSSVPTGVPSVVKNSEIYTTPPPPPPPPPPPMDHSTSNSKVGNAIPVPNSSQNCNKSSVNKLPNGKGKKQIIPVLDPREELMIEIRRFGGRQALRQVPNTKNTWRLQVYGKQSSVSS